MHWLGGDSRSEGGDAGKRTELNLLDADLSPGGGADLCCHGIAFGWVSNTQDDRRPGLCQRGGRCQPYAAAGASDYHPPSGQVWKRERR
jgi:hypothetical protein